LCNGGDSCGILFLTGLALLAIAANATTLSRLRFEELVKSGNRRARASGASEWKATGKVARSGQKRKLEVVELNKGLLPALFSVQMPWRPDLEICIRESRACQRSTRARKSTYFSGGMKRTLPSCWDGRKERFEFSRVFGREWRRSTQDSAAAPVFDPRTQPRSGMAEYSQLHFLAIFQFENCGRRSKKKRLEEFQIRRARSMESDR